MRRLLLLRPEPGLSRSAERARALGLDVVASPLFEIVPIEWTAPDSRDFDALLLTSANAIRQAGPNLAGLARLPVHAVGEASAAEARKAGLDVATIGDVDVDQLLRSLPPIKLLHLCGADRHETADPRITPIPVYRADPIHRPNLPPLARLVVAVHSPRAGRRLAELAEDRSFAIVAAISPAAAAACGPGWERVESADAPNDAALLALAARLCNSLSA